MTKLKAKSLVNVSGPSRYNPPPPASQAFHPFIFIYDKRTESEATNPEVEGSEATNLGK